MYRFSLHSHRVGGNSFANGPAPPPPPYAPPPPRRPHNNHNHSNLPLETPEGSKGQDLNQNHGKNKKGLTGGQIAGIVIGSIIGGGLCVALAVVFCLRKLGRGTRITKGRSGDIMMSPIVANSGTLVSSFSAL